MPLDPVARLYELLQPAIPLTTQEMDVLRQLAREIREECAGVILAHPFNYAEHAAIAGAIRLRDGMAAAISALNETTPPEGVALFGPVQQARDGTLFRVGAGNTTNAAGPEQLGPTGRERDEATTQTNPPEATSAPVAPAAPSDTPLTDAMTQPVSGKDCVTGEPIDVVHADDVRRLEVLLRQCVEALDDTRKLASSEEWDMHLQVECRATNACKRMDSALAAFRKMEEGCDE